MLFHPSKTEIEVNCDIVSAYLVPDESNIAQFTICWAFICPLTKLPTKRGKLQHSKLYNLCKVKYLTLMLHICLPSAL